MSDPVKPGERKHAHGRIVTEAQQPRTVLSGRVGGVGSDLYGIRPLGGERKGDLSNGGMRDRNDRLGGSHHGVPSDFFVPHEDIFEPEETLMDPSAFGGGVETALAAKECREGCLEYEFLCTHSCVCIPKVERCDGEQNCEDGEDEEECTETTKQEVMQELRAQCQKDDQHVLCPRTYLCIDTKWLCDGDDDCGDFSDETRCGERTGCSEDQFECANNLCIQKAWLCDGDNDCKDYSDEMNCTKLP